MAALVHAPAEAMAPPGSAPPAGASATPWRGERAVVAAAVVALVAVAALLRLLRLGDQPGGLFPDEAAEGLDAWRILHQPGFHPLYFGWGDDGGREVTFAYLVAAVFRVTGPSVLALRGTAAVLGILAVAVTPPALRRLGTPAAIGATAFAAGSVWLVAVDRDGMRDVLVPLTGTLALGALLAWADRPADRRRAALAGAACGLGLWTYQPLKLLPVLVALWLLWLRRADRARWSRLRGTLGVAVAAGAVVAAPIAAAAIMDPVAYFGRLLSVSAANPERGGLAALPGHVLRTLGMFGVLGDPNPRHDAGGMPLLPPSVLLLAVAGAARCWRRRADPRMRVLLLGVPVLLVPPLVAAEGAAPHFLRALGLEPFCAALVGLGVAAAVETGRRHRAAAGGTLAGVGAALLLGVPAALGAVDYLGRPVAGRYAAFSFGLVALAGDARARPGSVVVLDDYRAMVVRFVDVATPVRVERPGTPLRLPPGTAVLAIAPADLAGALGEEVARHATVLERDPGGVPAVWEARSG
jgi:Dolichyl-phosphate-mannose-protein mannosyltransferase